VLTVEVENRHFRPLYSDCSPVAEERPARVAASMESQFSIEAEVKAGPFHRGRGRGRGRIEADLLALQQATSFHFRSFIFVSSLAEDKEILSS